MYRVWNSVKKVETMVVSKSLCLGNQPSRTSSRCGYLLHVIFHEVRHDKTRFASRGNLQKHPLIGKSTIFIRLEASNLASGSNIPQKIQNNGWSNQNHPRTYTSAKIPNPASSDLFPKASKKNPTSEASGLARCQVSFIQPTVPGVLGPSLRGRST